LDALPAGKSNLHLRNLSLRVLAKEAAERAALEEYHAPDARAVFPTVPLDIHNKRKIILLFHR
jgi:hypothetical protein